MSIHLNKRQKSRLKDPKEGRSMWESRWEANFEHKGVNVPTLKLNFVISHTEDMARTWLLGLE
jgi:hypothetical protein